MDNKKKLLILIALFVVIITVGAFQMMSSGTPDKPAETKAKDTAKTDKADKDAKAGPANPLVAADLAQRNPFHQEDLLPPPLPTAQTAQAQQAAKPRRMFPRMPELPPAQIDKTGGIGPLGIAPVNQGAGYAVSGVILGSRPAAVFVDAQGGERLVPLNGSVDGDTKVVGIEKGAVSVRFRGKTIRIPTGGNGSGK